MLHRIRETSAPLQTGFYFLKACFLEGIFIYSFIHLEGLLCIWHWPGMVDSIVSRHTGHALVEFTVEWDEQILRKHTMAIMTMKKKSLECSEAHDSGI